MKKASEVAEREVESLRAEVKFRTGQVEEKCLTIESLTQQLAAKEEVLCGTRKALNDMAPCRFRLEVVKGKPERVHAESCPKCQALSSFCPCPHKQKAEKQLAEAKELAQSILKYEATVPAILGGIGYQEKCEARGKLCQQMIVAAKTLAKE